MDPANPDLRKFPKFGPLVGLEAVLEPGDILWFPGEYCLHLREQTPSADHPQIIIFRLILPPLSYSWVFLVYVCGHLEKE